MPRQVRMLNGYVVVVREKARKKSTETSMFNMPTSVSLNVGRVVYASDGQLLLGKLVYFRNQFEQMTFEGQEGLVMQTDNLVAEIEEE